MAKLDAAVYMEAAQIVAMPLSVFERTHSACEAIDNTSIKFSGPYIVAFARMFRPYGKGIGEYWFGDCEEPANQNIRILALCFAAAMAETGDL